MTKSRWWALLIVASVQLLWSIPAAIFGYKWLARDEPTDHSRRIVNWL
ncbi:hypothetical protein [Mycolicibacterium sp. 120270]|nr:hypothetical protein [Mycolicibacterium sp. 120270]MDX1887816.1 hypothetical protein [Mycolicibacterium sp. 120270]